MREGTRIRSPPHAKLFDFIFHFTTFSNLPSKIIDFHAAFERFDNDSNQWPVFQIYNPIQNPSESFKWIIKALSQKQQLCSISQLRKLNTDVFSHFRSILPSFYLIYNLIIVLIIVICSPTTISFFFFFRKMHLSYILIIFLLISLSNNVKFIQASGKKLKLFKYFRKLNNRLSFSKKHTLR